MKAEDGGVIDIDLNAAPDVEDLVEVRLVSGGEDVTDTYCRPADPIAGAVLTCSGLPAAQYDVETIGVPDGLRTTVNCIDTVASRALPPVSTTEFAPPWRCVAFVGTPAVLLTVNSGAGGPVLDAGSLELALVDGLTPDCVDDEVNDSPATRCRDLPIDTYDVVVTDVPETAVVETPLCQALLFGDDLELAFGPAAALTDEQWLWWCNVLVEPPAIIGLASTSGEQPDPDGAGLQVIGPAGDVTSRCASSGSGSEPGRWYWSCDLDVGNYAVTFTGIPAENVVDSCESFDVTIGQAAPLRCVWTVRLTSVTPTTSTTPPTSPGLLPATGRSTSPAFWLAMAALIGGGLLVTFARRPTSR